MDFLKHGFKTGNVVLPGINLEVILPRNRYFRNDGIVANLENHTLESLAQLGFSTRNLFHDFSGSGGYSLNCGDGSEIDNRGTAIYILGADEFTNCFRYGHESIHTMIHLGIEDKFLDLLKYEGFSLNPFARFDDEELIADIGGIIATYRNIRPLLRIDEPEYLSELQKELFYSNATLMSKNK